MQAAIHEEAGFSSLENFYREKIVPTTLISENTSGAKYSHVPMIGKIAP